MHLPFDMSWNKTKPFWICAVLFGLIFTVLFSLRLGLFSRLNSNPKTVSLSGINSLPAKDAWMNIFQNGRKIGSSHTTFSKTASGYRLQEKIHMRINTMGLVQDIRLNTGGRLNTDFTLSSFDFEISSGRFRFMAEGTISNDILSIQTLSSGSKRKIDIKLKESVYIIPGILKAVAASGLVPGDEFAFQIFDPATMGREAVIVRVISN